jgi:multidrug resistance efflux pump
VKRPVVVALVLLVAAAVGILVIARRRAAEDGLVFSGTIEVRDVQVGSLVGGRVAAILVEEGATVASRQPLVRFETDLLDPQLREQEGRVAEARARLALVIAGPRREELERARAEADNAERDRQRLEHLLGEGIIGQQQYDEAATKARTTAEAYRQLERGSRAEDVAAARAAVTQAEQRLGYLREQKDETVVRAPRAGVIEVMALRPGDLVAANQPVATLLEPDQIWVRIYVPEPRLGLVRLGQRAAISVDTFPKRSFGGKIVEIRTRGEYTPRNIQTLEQRQDQVFGVKVQIDPVPELKAGMAALVRLEP